MQAVTSSTSTIMCADTPAREHLRGPRGSASAGAGFVVEGDDDRVIVAFDSAAAAVETSVELQHAWPGMRIGLATGDVVWADGGCSGAPVGIAVALFGRARARADPGQQRGAVAPASGTIGNYVGVGPVEIEGINVPSRHLRSSGSHWSAASRDGPDDEPLDPVAGRARQGATTADGRPRRQWASSPTHGHAPKRELVKWC